MTQSIKAQSQNAVVHISTVAFSETTAVILSHKSFLSNDYNKKRLLAMLMTEMRAKVVEVKQAVVDAAVLIIFMVVTLLSEYDRVIITR